MGNGLPIGGVICTAELAESFDNGMEYFNTFGGNAISTLASITTIKILQEFNLKEQA
eukprot:CAMPEP_0116893788 /NCGR_PEP_ID=MMETSP0467-20121206/3711_1 /TAXON_ID=283647 /ORGANISM="Mesodinium pulex, Strain SPMC105" /LENGTH=56 /DNA_ID=CAMNT_0004563667 /DNA_START=736 /DNA_END=906 /DNA_ORIENTATION=+